MTSRTITVAAIQSSFGADTEDNIAKMEGFVREAAKRDAQIVLPSELFQSIYFPTKQDPKWFGMAKAVNEHPSVLALQRLAKELRLVIPISFFEKDGPRYYNSVAVADADGEILGVYRKSHIPDGPGYQEKYYFRPGDTGFKAWKTKAGTIGVGICWDQWYPEAARAMMLQGAEILLYPTAIGAEQNGGATQSYYGYSFIADHSGELAASFGDKEEGVLVASFDLAEIERYRAEWGFFRDRRTDLYAKSIV